MTLDPEQGWARLVLPGDWPQGHSGLLLDYLEQRFRGVSRQELGQRLEKGEIVHELGVPLGEHASYRRNTPLFYRRRHEPEQPVPFQEQVIYCDERILVADKPPFLTVVPAGQHWRETLLMRLRKVTGINTLVPMHRIDRETSGLVMFTVIAGERGPYQSLFETRQVRKTYQAIAPLRRELPLPMMYESHLREGPAFMQMIEVPEARPNASCHIRLLETQGPYGRFEIEPITGRKHQIRAQMAALGMPICNDRVYPVLKPHDPTDFSAPLKLLAQALEFTDPFTGQRREFSSLQSLQFPVDLP